MSKVYAVIGGVYQSICDTCPPDHIEMEGMRPEGDFVASANGTWVDNSVNTERNRHLSGKEFMELFTPDELVAIYTHAEAHIEVKIWLHRLVGAEYVIRTDSALQTGMAYMVYQNLLTQERHNAIMVQ